MTEFSKFLNEISPLGVEEQLSQESLLWREGDPGTDVVLLLDGMLEVTHSSPEGEEVAVRSVGPGAILGEIASLDGLARSAAVRAATPCRVLRIPAPAFRDLLRQRADILEELFWLQVRRVRTLTEEVVRSYRPALTDRLTKLYSSSFFRDRLRGELERARETGDLVSVVLLGIDSFEDFVAASGSVEGNEALLRLADLVRKSARRGDLLARYRADDLACLMYGATAEDAEHFAEEIRRRVEATPFRDGAAQPRGRVTVSASVTVFPIDGGRVDLLLDTAESRLFEAKKYGNRVTTRPS